MRDYHFLINGNEVKVENAPLYAIQESLTYGVQDPSPEVPDADNCTNEEFRLRLEIELIARQLEGRL